MLDDQPRNKPANRQPESHNEPGQTQGRQQEPQNTVRQENHLKMH